MNLSIQMSPCLLKVF